MTFAAPPASRIGKSLQFTAGANAPSYGWDDGGTGIGIIGTPADAKTIYWRGARLQGLVQDNSGAGSGTYYLSLYVRLRSSTPDPDQGYASLAAMIASDAFFSRLTVRNNAGAVLASLRRQDATQDTSFITYGSLTWLLPAFTSVITNGQVHTMDLA